MKVNLYDFDNTIYKGDSSVDFFFFSLMKYPKIIKYLPKMGYYAILYKLNKITKTKMKECNFSFLKDIPKIDAHVKLFWKSHRIYIKSFYKEIQHNKDIIISASPEFLLKPICEELEVYDLIASKVNKNNGKFTGLNCYHEEKVKRLYKKYPSILVMKTYTDSLSDIPILKLAKKQFLVKGNTIEEVEY